MENRNLNNSLFYGNIVKLESASKELLNDTLFFVDYIDETKLKLVSENMETQIFHLNENGGIDNIDKILIINKQEDGYCVINRLLPGKLIKINFANEDAFIQGQIRKLENDMIVVKTQENELLYIDFEYSGLLEKYNIRSIEIIKSYQNYQTGEYDIVDNGRNTEDTTMLSQDGRGQTMYTIEQQVNDFIEKSKFTSKNKKNVISEISKYKLLLEEYTALDSGIKIKQLPNNQILYSVFDLNPKIVNLFSSYLHKELFYNPDKVGNYEFDSTDTEVSNWQYSVIGKSHASLEEFSDHNNIIPINTKIKNYHKKIRLQTEQNIALVNKVTRSNNSPFFFSIGKDGEIQVVPYDTVRAEKGEKFILNGLIFKNMPSIYNEMNIHHSSNILSKSLQNLYVRYEKTPKAKLLNSDVMERKDYFDNKRVTFYEFPEDKTFKEYIEDLDFGLKEVYEKIFDRKEVSMFQCVKKLALFNISKMNVMDHAFIQKLVRENISVTKKAINEQRAHFIKMNKRPDNYEYVPHENMYEIVKNSYLSNKKSKTSNIHYHMGELLKIASIDNMELLLFELKQLNRTNTIDFDDEDVDNYILDLQAQLNGEIPKDTDTNRVDYSKYYRKKDEMLRDVNKIILKNINKTENSQTEKYDPIQYCYENVINGAKFDGDLNNFVKELDLLLKIMHEENDKFAEFEDAFKNEADRDNILSVLFKLIKNTQIRQDDKCYVEEEKKFYIYDGNKWNSAEETNSSLSKKKFLQVKNSIDEFENIKTRIIHDSVIKYAHKNEKDDDKKDISSENERNKMITKVKSLKENKIRELLKYNKQKYEYQQLFDKLDYETLQDYSPHTNLLHMILCIDDLERKYNLIQRFISLFTIDNGDEKWFFCISKNVKLMPKYLKKLSEAYLLYNNHESVVKEICHLEGHLSEEGDAWIHKDSGFVIKKIDFDTNYGYDENGFKIKLDTIDGIDNLETDEDDVENDKNTFSHNNKPRTIKPPKKHNKQTMRLLKELMPIMMKDLDVKFRHNDDTNLIYATMEEIFQESSQHPKYESLSIIGNIYVVASMILIYVQCKNVAVGQSYLSCNMSFSGFPYQEDESSLDGIKYLACYLQTRLDPENKKNNDKRQLSNILVKIFSKFSSFKKTEENITNDIFDYIKLFFLKSVFVKDMILQKRNFESKHPKATFISEPLAMFKPALVKITTQDADDEHGFKHKTDDFIDKHEKQKRQIEMINMKIEEEIKESIKKEEPLLKSHYQEPFMVNYCCQDKELTVQSLPKSELSKSQLSKLVKKSNELFETISEEQFTCFKGTTMVIPKLHKNEEEINTVTRIYSQDSLYSFLASLLQFENKDKSIPEHLKTLAKEHNIEELDDNFYTEMEELGKNGDISQKIKLLEKYDIDINSSFMEKVLSKHHKYHFEKQKNRYQLEHEKLRLKNSNKTKVFSDFQFEYIENVEFNKLNVGFHDNDFLLGNKEASAANNVDAVSRAVDVEQGDKTKLFKGKNIIDKFEEECKILSGNYKKFISSHLNKSNYKSINNNMKTLMVQLKNGAYLEKKDNDQFELYIKQLYNINYQLISLVPGLLFNKEFHNGAGYNQFNFADAHINDLKKHRQDYRGGFKKITNASEETIEILKTISDHKEILYLKTFNNKRINKYYFLLYLLYKTLNYYIELNESIDVVANINIEIIKMILEYMKNTSYSYDKMITNKNQSKQSEKFLKTESLRQMRPQEREAEKYKMAAKLGDWSYGNQSRVFKYYKQFYHEDTEKANEIKNVARELYSESITDGSNELYENSHFENSLSDIINNEEAQEITLVGDEDGIVLDEEGCEINDYE